jgi:hypothetical protein
LGAVSSHLSFSLPRAQIVDRVLIPKFYDPELREGFDLARSTFDLVPLSALLCEGATGSRLGHWIRREHYGSGPIPYVRTSDLVGWRIRPDFKKGVSEALYAEMAAKQDVAVNDILMVAHGTYLVGNVALVTERQQTILYQDHVFRLRVSPEAIVGPEYLLAALSTPFVRRQVRSRQFSADIIDKLGDRHLGIVVPIHKNTDIRRAVSDEVRGLIDGHASVAEAIENALKSARGMVRERSRMRLSFSVARSGLRGRTLIPKYHDPDLAARLDEASAASSRPWVSLQHLVEDGLLTADTGVEVGKMAYGMGEVPFVRTSDIADLELRADNRHYVDAATYADFPKKGRVRSEDVLVVRDGTYLVGSSAIVAPGEEKALICGGIYRLRSADHRRLDPYGLLGSLNLPIVREQMRSKQFTRDVIDTLGKRLLEVLIPSPDSDEFQSLATTLKAQMRIKSEMKGRARRVVETLDPPSPKKSLGRPGWSMRS